MSRVKVRVRAMVRAMVRVRIRDKVHYRLVMNSMPPLSRSHDTGERKIGT